MSGHGPKMPASVIRGINMDAAMATLHSVAAEEREPTQALRDIMTQGKIK